VINFKFVTICKYTLAKIILFFNDEPILNGKKISVTVKCGSFRI